MIAPDNTELLRHLTNWGTAKITAKKKSRSPAWRAQVQYKLYKTYEGLKNFSGDANDLATIKLELRRTFEHASRFCCDTVLRGVNYTLLKANENEHKRLGRLEESLQGTKTDDIINYALYQLRAKVLSKAIDRVYERATRLRSKSDIRKSFVQAREDLSTVDGSLLEPF